MAMQEHVISIILANILLPFGLLTTNKAGEARTQAPTATNYDVGSATWTDLRRAPLPSAMEVTSLGHGSS
ncbi:hypothetical protein CIPAW_07G008700 [Carya illinoinensis]|uniref:Uncharacterized protein n=1 Tax=Carya illinoinensis TaxID=32201 RepID=A0A8T1PXU9_CARIL|nr:hypothetical protein CIPAW_07G008700 [Carya illinoinensis]